MVCFEASRACRLLLLHFFSTDRNPQAAVVALGFESAAKIGRKSVWPPQKRERNGLFLVQSIEQPVFRPLRQGGRGGKATVSSYI